MRPCLGQHGTNPVGSFGSHSEEWAVRVIFDKLFQFARIHDMIDFYTFKTPPDLGHQRIICNILYIHYGAWSPAPSSDNNVLSNQFLIHEPFTNQTCVGPQALGKPFLGSPYDEFIVWPFHASTGELLYISSKGCIQPVNIETAASEVNLIDNLLMCARLF